MRGFPKLYGGALVLLISLGVVLVATRGGTGTAPGATGAQLTIANEAKLPGDAAQDPVVTLGSVSCTSAGNCVVVGSYTTKSGTQQALLMSQSSGAWQAAVKAPLPSDAEAAGASGLASVSCGAPDACTAVGTYLDNSGQARGLLVSESGGNWTARSAPLPPDAATPADVNLGPVSCAGSDSCVAVGSYVGSSSGQPEALLLSETAGRWTAIAAPLPADAGGPKLQFTGGQLSSVSCGSTTECTAVGIYYDGSGNLRGLLISGGGDSWTASAAPLPADGLDQGQGGDPKWFDLTSVACPSAGNCTAVGFYQSLSGEEGLLLGESGGEWTATEVQPPRDASTEHLIELDAVACATAGNCAAVGSYDTPSGTGGLLLTEENGAWSAGAPAPVPTNTNLATLGTVACASSGSCTTAGFYLDSSSHQHPWSLAKGGSGWTGAAAPLPPNWGSGSSTTPGALIDSISCPSASDCVAVGSYPDTSGNQQGLLLTTGG